MVHFDEWRYSDSKKKRMIRGGHVKRMKAMLDACVDVNRDILR
jgi:hypothetical protein